MKITTRFNCGDTVYKISRDTTREWISCAACNATGRIGLLDGTNAACPRCHALKGDFRYGNQEWQINERMLTIGQIRVEVTDSPGIHGEEMFDNYKAQSAKIETYMCIETGIGSGTLHNGMELFATREETLAECERRNSDARQRKGR